MKRIGIWLIFLTMLMLHSSCAHVAMIAMGMKQPKELSQKKLKRVTHKMNIPESRSFYADTNYLNLIVNLPKDRGIQKNHSQPIQAMYFNKDAKYPSAWYINCYSKATTFQLLWNADSSFNVFPPKGNAPIDSGIVNTSFEKYMYPVFPEAKFKMDPDKMNVIVIYCRIFNRQSRNLIRFVQQNAKLSDTDVNINYINIDNVYAGAETELVN